VDEEYTEVDEDAKVDEDWDVVKGPEVDKVSEADNDRVMVVLDSVSVGIGGMDIVVVIALGANADDVGTR